MLRLAAIVVAASVMLLITPGAHAGDARASLLEKGFSEETLEGMNSICLRSLDQRVPEGALWYATFDRDTRTLTVDLQTPDKVHHSFLFASMREDRCNIYHAAVYVIERDFVTEAKGWYRTLRQKGLEVEVLEETPQRICLVGAGNSGIKVFLYPMGKYTLGIFRDFQALTIKVPPPEKGRSP